MVGCFVTGTDTEVGKSVVSAGLLHWLGQQGVRAAGYKPVAAGMEQLADGSWVNEDIQRLHAASASGIAVEQIGCYCLPHACAPHIAAEQAGLTLQASRMQQGLEQLRAQVDCVVVEGAGGVRIPLAEGFDSADLMVALQLPVILVVGMRLGCINHALLSVEAIQSRGLRLAGWVANQPQAQPMAFAQHNRHTLQQLIAAPLLGEIPFVRDGSAEQVAAAFDLAALRQVFGLKP